MTNHSITHVHQGIWVGGDPHLCTDPSVDTIILNSMDLIIDVRSGHEGEGWEQLLTGPRIVKETMFDDGKRQNNTESFLNIICEVEKTAAELGIEPKDVLMFVHCHMGVNRSTSVVMFLLLSIWGMSPQEAFLKVRETRTQAGLAAADVAVAAMGYNVKEWYEFEDAYWKQHGYKSVNDFIHAMRDIDLDLAWTDINGAIHVTGKES